MSNAIYAQSGGVTAVINATACGLIRNYPSKVYAAKNGIIGVIQEELFDTSKLNDHEVESLKYRPGGAFGSCRYRLPTPEEDETVFKRILQVCEAHDIQYFFYNGGNDSHDTCAKINNYALAKKSNLRCIGLPKTIDNDLEETDFCPGYPSAARFIAMSTMEIAMDLQAMAKSSTKVFVLEVMGRHTGWLAAASAHAKGVGGISAPHIVLTPEYQVEFDQVIEHVHIHIKQSNHCLVVVAEGVNFSQLTVDQHSKDAFGHSQLGGLAPKLAENITRATGYKNHWSVPDYLQRSASNCASGVDVELAYQVGQAGAQAAIDGVWGVSITIERELVQQSVEFKLKHTPLDKLANFEKKLPEHFIDKEALNISEDFRHWLRPLITERKLFKQLHGLPHLPVLNMKFVPAKLPIFTI